MSRVLMIKAESSDWCGISDTFVYTTELEDDEEALEEALDAFSDTMEEHLYEYYEGEDDEDYIASEEASYNYSAEWHTKEVYGDADSLAYHKLN